MLVLITIVTRLPWRWIIINFRYIWASALAPSLDYALYVTKRFSVTWQKNFLIKLVGNTLPFLPFDTEKRHIWPARNNEYGTVLRKNVLSVLRERIMISIFLLKLYSYFLYRKCIALRGQVKQEIASTFLWSQSLNWYMSALRVSYVHDITTSN